MKATLLITILNGEATFLYGQQKMPIKVANSPMDGQYVISGNIRQGKSDGRLSEVWINPTGMVSINPISSPPPTTTKKTNPKSQAKAASKSSAKQSVAANPFA